MKKILVALLVAMLALIATAALAEHDNCCVTVADYLAPTCTQKGYTEYTCGCSIIHDELGHEIKGENVEPTCVKDGYYKEWCLNCEDYSVVIPKKATGVHTVDEAASAKNYVAPTCTTEGYWKNVCSVCKGTIAEGKLDKLGHAKNSTFVDIKVAETCTTPGIAIYHCTRCGKDYDVEYDLVKGHAMSAWTTVAPKCMEDGQKVRVCTNEGCKEKEVVVIPAIGHDIRKTSIKTVDGVEVGFCSNCEEWVPTNEKPAAKPEVKPEEKPSTDKEETKPSKPATKPSTPNKPTTNKDGVTIPATGETMNVAPFIMMLVAIVGLAVTKQKVTE